MDHLHLLVISYFNKLFQSVINDASSKFVKKHFLLVSCKLKAKEKVPASAFASCFP